MGIAVYNTTKNEIESPGFKFMPKDFERSWDPFLVIDVLIKSKWEKTVRQSFIKNV